MARPKTAQARGRAPSLALVIWARLVTAQVEEELQSLGGLDVQGGSGLVGAMGPWP